MGFGKPYLFFVIIAGAMMIINAGTGAFAEPAEPALPSAVRNLAQKAFAQKTAAEVRQFFEKNIATLPNAQAQVQALMLLADYEQYHGNYSNAAECYRRAAGLDTSEGKTALLLDAVRALLCGGSFDSARSLLTEIAAALPVSDDDPYYRRAAVYDTWRLLAEDRADRAVPLITAYTKKKAFEDYHPALLFTLWWVNGDEDAKQRLLKEYPSGMEAAAVNGTVTVQPSTFWYLMPKSALAQQPVIGGADTKTGAARKTEVISAQPSKQSNPSPQPTGTTSATQSVTQSTKTGTVQSAKAAAAEETHAKPTYYQLGFYKTKKYAEALAADLQKKQFTPIIKEETRPSGTVYFAVLVKENAAGDMGLRLKDAGYEAFPIFP
ncbi:SPOR domain-containing protein [Treponema vincentii]|uniref:SPOR domain-containing protein n=1 Tax=Treponema vincentii TaxID=69710 RepID=UPI0020A5E96E|nr:SPOR domain-containing protein [Treponema vincentii]